MKLNSNQAMRTDPSSAPIIEDIFSIHFPRIGSMIPTTVLDLTYHSGRFWKWDWESKGIELHGNGWPDDSDAIDQLGMVHSHSVDWSGKTGFRDRCFDIVVYDPPHTSSGPASDGGTQAESYGADRTKGGPKDMPEVQSLFVNGLFEAMRIADAGIIVKIQPMVESRMYWPTHALVYASVHHEQSARKGEFYVADEVYLRGPRRSQPPNRNVEHFHSKPSIFMVLKRK